MIALIQRVTQAAVFINKKQYSSINKGYIIFLGIFKEDAVLEIDKLVDKIVNLRIMSDENGKMNKSIIDTKDELLVVSQFTLCANLKDGRRPDFFPAKEPKDAERLYNIFTEKLKQKGVPVKTGKFAAYMEVQIFNSGPVTFILDSKKI